MAKVQITPIETIGKSAIIVFGWVMIAGVVVPAGVYCADWLVNAPKKIIKMVKSEIEVRKFQKLMEHL